MNRDAAGSTPGFWSLLQHLVCSCQHLAVAEEAGQVRLLISEHLLPQTMPVCLQYDHLPGWLQHLIELSLAPTHLGLAQLASQVELWLSKAAVAVVGKVDRLCHTHVGDVAVMLQADNNNTHLGSVLEFGMSEAATHTRGQRALDGLCATCSGSLVCLLEGFSPTTAAYLVNDS